MNKRRFGTMLTLALIAGLVGGVVSSQFLVGQTAFAWVEKAWPQKIVVANRIELVDKNGDERLILDATNDQPVIRLREVPGVDRLVLGLNYHAQPTLLMIGKYGIRVGLQLKENGEPYLEFCRTNGDPGLTVRLDVDGNPQVTLVDNKGKARARFFIDGQDGEPNLTLLDMDGKAVWQAPYNDQ